MDLHDDTTTEEEACQALGHMPEPEKGVVFTQNGQHDVMQIRCQRCGQLVVGYE